MIRCAPPKYASFPRVRSFVPDLHFPNVDNKMFQYGHKRETLGTHLLLFLFLGRLSIPNYRMHLKKMQRTIVPLGTCHWRMTCEDMNVCLCGRVMFTRKYQRS